MELRGKLTLIPYLLMEDSLLGLATPDKMTIAEKVYDFFLSMEVKLEESF